MQNSPEMNALVEAVSQALQDEIAVANKSVDCGDLARAAILATLRGIREPGDDAIFAGDIARENKWQTQDVWSAMIDAKIKEMTP